MKENLILAGTGGQGVLSISYVIDNAAFDAGYYFRQAEVHGMAQRGGAVQSHLRYSDQAICCDLIPTGRATMLLSVEPLEALRSWHSLAPDGWVVSSVTPYINIPNYPETEFLLAGLSAAKNLVLFDGGRIAKAAGNLRAQNMAALGAASPHLDFTEEQLLKFVEKLFAAKGERIVKVNSKAFHLGRAAGLFFRGLVDAGCGPIPAIRLCQKLVPESIDPSQVASWAGLLGDPGQLEVLLGSEGDLDCERPGV